MKPMNKSLIFQVAEWVEKDPTAWKLKGREFFSSKYLIVFAEYGGDWNVYESFRGNFELSSWESAYLKRIIRKWTRRPVSEEEYDNFKHKTKG